LSFKENTTLNFLLYTNYRNTSQQGVKLLQTYIAFKQVQRRWLNLLKDSTILCH